MNTYLCDYTVKYTQPGGFPRAFSKRGDMWHDITNPDQLGHYISEVWRATKGQSAEIVDLTIIPLKEARRDM